MKAGEGRGKRARRALVICRPGGPPTQRGAREPGQSSDDSRRGSTRPAPGSLTMLGDSREDPYLKLRAEDVGGCALTVRPALDLQVLS